MHRRLAVILCITLLGILGVLWVALKVEPESALGPQIEPRAGRAPSDLEATSAPQGEPTIEHRADLSQIAGAPQEQDSASLADGPTLIVKVQSKESREPLGNVRLTVLKMPSESNRGSSHGSQWIPGPKGDLEHSPITGSEGQVLFVLPAGYEFTLCSSCEDDAVESRHEDTVPALGRNEHRTMVIKLATVSDLHYFGRVLAQTDHLPIPGATISVIKVITSFVSDKHGGGTKQAESQTVAKVQTDSNGVFELSIPSWQSLDVHISAEGFSETFVALAQAHDTREKAKEVVLSPAATLEVRLVDSRGGPIEDVCVRLHTQSYNVGTADHGELFLPHTPECEWRQDKGKGGWYKLEGLPGDTPLHVMILREGRTIRADVPDLSLKPGKGMVLEWTIGSGCAISGRVTDQSGAVVNRSDVWLQRANHEGPTFFDSTRGAEVTMKATTDAEGRYEFRDVSPGMWWVGPAATKRYWDAPDSKAIAPAAKVVIVREGESYLEVDLKVTRGLYIRGTVFNSRLEFARHTSLTAHSEQIGLPASGQTTEDGTFAIGPLIAGKYIVIADGFGTGDAASDPVEAEAGQSDVLLRLRAGGRISGVIRSDSTEEVGRCEVIFQRVTTSGRLGLTRTESNLSGSFILRGLEPGTYDLCVSTAGGACAVSKGIVVRTGEETGGVVLDASPGAHLRVRYVGEDGYLNFTALFDGVIVGGDGVKAGNDRDIVVPAGRIIVKAQWPPRVSEEREVSLPVGGFKELVFAGK